MIARTNGAWRQPLHRIGILQQCIDDREQGEARVRQDIEPNRTLEAAAQGRLLAPIRLEM